MALVAAPALWFPVPFSWDFFNHAARFSVLSAAPGDPVLRFYAVHWGVIPNLGIDALYWLLRDILSPVSFLRCLWIVDILLMGAGAWLLSATLHGRPPVTILAVPVLSYNVLLTTGLFNFALGAGLGLVCLSLWLRLRDRPVAMRLVAFNVMAVLLFFAHLVAFAVTVGLIGLMETFPRLRWPRWADIVRGVAVAPFFVAGLVLLLASEPLETKVGFAVEKNLKTLLYAPLASVSLLSDQVAMLGLAAVLFLIIRRGGCRFDPRMSAALLVAYLVVLAMPTSYGPGSLLDARVHVYIAFVAVASLSLRRPQADTRGLVIAFALLIAARVALVLGPWNAFLDDLADVRRTLAAIPPQSRVLVGHVVDDVCEPKAASPQLAHAYQHAVAAAVLERGSFVHLLFTGRGMQPVEVRPEWRRFVLPWQALTPREVTEVLRDDAALAPTSGRVFDTFVLFHFGCRPAVPPAPGLVKAAEGRVDDVYRIAEDAPAPPPAPAR